MRRPLTHRQVVTIDDRLPYWQRPGKHGNLCFAKPTKENEFWPCLLESLGS